MKRSFRACDGRKVTVEVTQEEIRERILYYMGVTAVVVIMAAVMVVASDYHFF